MKKLLLGLFCVIALSINAIDENNDIRKEQCQSWYREIYSKLSQEQKCIVKDYYIFLSYMHAKGLDLIEKGYYKLFANYTQKAEKEVGCRLEQVRKAEIQLPTLFDTEEKFDVEKFVQIQNRIYQLGGHTTEQYCELCMQDAECKEFFMRTVRECISDHNTILQVIEEQETLEQQR